MVLNKKKKSNTNKRKLISAFDPRSSIYEQYRTIRTNIQFSSVDQEIKSIMVTSPSPGEGKSTTAANMAVIYAQQEKRVLLVDTDLRKPTVHYTFNFSNHIGLTNVLTGVKSLKESIIATEVEHLSVLTSGSIPPNPAELLGSNRMKHLLKEAKEEFDIIILDTPPALVVADAQILANISDAILLVLYSRKTEIEQAQKAKELLLSAKGKLLGAVLNHKKLKKTNYNYYYGT